MSVDKNKTPKQLAIDISHRSSCSVRVGSVITDRKGRIISWAWNHQGFDGFGCCAETGAILRANRRRLRGSTIFVAGFRAKNGNPVTSRPCTQCQRMLTWCGIAQCYYLNNSNQWEKFV